MDFIQGEKFIGLADWVYSPPNTTGIDDYNQQKNTFELSKLKDGDKIYTHTMYVRSLLAVLRSFEGICDIISHNGDVNIDLSFKVPKCVRNWFTQNVDVIDEKIIPLPIGLENSRWFQGLHKREKMIAKVREPKNYKNLVYVNHNVATNPAKRLKPYEVLYGKPWATLERRANGDRFDEYLNDIYNHKFVVCPEGNGIDTHRVWETLYMGSIPIVKDCITAELLYSYYPVVIVKDWDEITEEYLNKKFQEISHIKSQYDITPRLTFQYWADKINNYVGSQS